jgi:hypothetical protein
MDKKKTLLGVGLISSAFLSTSLVHAGDFTKCATQCSPAQCQLDVNKAKECVEACTGVPNLPSYLSACKAVVSKASDSSSQGGNTPKPTPESNNNPPKNPTIPDAPPLPGIDKENVRPPVQQGKNNKGAEIREMMVALGHLDQDLKALYRKFSGLTNAITLKRLNKEKEKLEKKRGKLADKIKAAGGKNIPPAPKAPPQKKLSDNKGADSNKGRPLPKPANSPVSGGGTPVVAPPPPNNPPSPPANPPKAPEVKTPKAPATGGRGALLDQIHKGTKLKKVDPKKVAEERKKAQGSGNSMMDALRGRMKERADSMNPDEASDDEASDDEGWDD